MTKVSVIGLFCAGREVSDGQSIKTRIITDELEKALGAQCVRRIDTYGWKKHPVRLFSDSIRAVLQSENVIFMTDEGGIKIFPWLLLGANIFGKSKLHYIVIGDWLVPFLEKHSFIMSCLKGFHHIFAETTSMQAGLLGLGFQNVSLLPNFKNLMPLRQEQLQSEWHEPYRFCTFSRVMREKGIGDAVDAVRAVNAQYGRKVCELDIYGAVEPDETQWFRELSRDFGDAIQYCGVVSYDKTTEVLEPYFALLFPTFFPKEGIPGTIIDAYAAGLPVIASKWKSFDDMVDDGITGIGYPYLNNECLKEIISRVVANPDECLIMKSNCLRKAEQFLPENTMKILLKELV